MTGRWLLAGAAALMPVILSNNIDEGLPVSEAMDDKKWWSCKFDQRCIAYSRDTPVLNFELDRDVAALDN